jgi:hypothetical protein
MVVSKAAAVAKEMLNDLTRAFPGLDTRDLTALGILLSGVMSFCFFYLDDSPHSPMNEIADRAGIERNTLDSVLRDIIAIRVGGIRGQV